MSTLGFQSVAPPDQREYGINALKYSYFIFIIYLFICYFRGQTSAEERQRAIEQSKYLGGDMEHTHLVKGLDFALLNRIRSELEKEKREKQNSEDDDG